jgi:hypothetical protein
VAKLTITIVAGIEGFERLFFAEGFMPIVYGAAPDTLRIKADNN